VCQNWLQGWAVVATGEVPGEKRVGPTQVAVRPGFEEDVDRQQLLRGVLERLATTRQPTTEVIQRQSAQSRMIVVCWVFVPKTGAADSRVPRRGTRS